MAWFQLSFKNLVRNPENKAMRVQPQRLRERQRREGTEDARARRQGGMLWKKGCSGHRPADTKVCAHEHTAAVTDYLHKS